MAKRAGRPICQELWQHFRYDCTDGNSTCLVPVERDGAMVPCNKLVRSGKSTGNLEKHLERYHHDVFTDVQMAKSAKKLAREEAKKKKPLPITYYDQDRCVNGGSISFINCTNVPLSVTGDYGSEVAVEELIKCEPIDYVDSSPSDFDNSSQATPFGDDVNVSIGTIHGFERCPSRNHKGRVEALISLVQEARNESLVRFNSIESQLQELLTELNSE